ncbi:T9SS type A sorting domain-containing protein [Mucilaginibacter sp. CAU 1740]|uniref:T9SS type A sorting domain-containing protein n=1 Tax=Mucilaginibacter sp. CAU 1740 TaxID=3140365 RepID=UPI00325ACBD0
MRNFFLSVLTVACCLLLCYTQIVKPRFSPHVSSLAIADSDASSPTSLPEIQYHLTARPWNALNISSDVYLSRVEGVVREVVKYQNSDGAIIDPYARREVQYSTPYFANAVGTLLSAGKATDLLNAGILAMNHATANVNAGVASIPDNHGEFYLAALASAIPLYTPFVSATQLQTWKTRMGKPLAAIISSRTNNWRSYAMKGEWLRAQNGYVNMGSAVNWIENSWVTTQKARLTNNSWNFYHDTSTDPDAWAYEAVGRSNLLAMVFNGYSGASKDEILNILKRGTQSSLLMQDPSGQAVAGGRSGNHTWNDILLANGYEIMAEIVNKEGNLRLAGQYRHAAALAFQSAQRWIRPNRTYSVTKNLFDPSAKVGYASYSFVTNYNGNMMFHMAENYLLHKSVIQEEPTPNEIGGYTMVSDNQFATAVANAGGITMEACLRGSTEALYNRYWTTLGVVRFAKPGWDSRLGPSDGTRDASTNLGVSFAPTFLENGKWISLASVPDRYEAFFTTQFTHPLLVRCQIVYKPKSGKTGPTFTNIFTITPDGVLSTLTSTSGNFGVTWPVMSFDGSNRLTSSLTSKIASVSYPTGTDQQNFIALHANPVISAVDKVIRSAYGDILPVRMVSGNTNNVTFIYPRSSGDASAESVRASFVRSGGDFSSVLAKVQGNTYVGRTSAGGVATSLDTNNDGTADIVFNTSTGFIMQLAAGKITKVETDTDVTGVIGGQTYSFKAYTPLSITAQGPSVKKVVVNTNKADSLNAKIYKNNSSVTAGLLADSIHSESKYKIADFEFNNNTADLASKKDAEKYDFKVWPVPTQGLLNLQSSDFWANSTVTVYSFFGKIVTTGSLNGTFILLDLSKMAKGTYIVRLTKNGKTAARKILLQ